MTLHLSNLTPASRKVLRVLSTDTVPPGLFISRNEKTGYSINVPIEKTCRPTADCDVYCYGNRGPISWPKSIDRQMDNHRRFEYLRGAPNEEIEAEADAVYRAVIRVQTFLRMFGVGDLTDGSVRFINAIASRHPDLAVWVSTRKLEFARKLLRLPNLHIMVSVDKSTKGEDFHQTYEYVQARAPQAFGAYVQQKEQEAVPAWAKVIFAEHKGAKRAEWSAEHFDARTCPATIVDGAEHNDACANCHYCFDAERRDAGRP